MITMLISGGNYFSLVLESEVESVEATLTAVQATNSMELHLTHLIEGRWLNRIMAQFAEYQLRGGLWLMGLSTEEIAVWIKSGSLPMPQQGRGQP